jgi:hypothetical protein
MPINIVAYCAGEIGIPPNVVRRIAAGAPKMYKRFPIKKRGGRGVRIVAQPAREVKVLQRAIVRFLSKTIAVHEAATAYVKGASVVRNASVHLCSNYILKMDFEEFFESISMLDVQHFLRLSFGGGITDAEIELISRAVTWRNPVGLVSLCIGAPSSPFLSNAMMFIFDARISLYCKEHGVTYTRYSDDLTFGAESRELLVLTEGYVRKVVAELGVPQLRLNEKKRVLVGRASARRITGTYLSTQGKLTVGRLRKRGIRAGVKKFLSGGLSEKATKKLKGEIAFACDVEEDFPFLLRRWYGQDVAPLVPKRFSTGSDW